MTTHVPPRTSGAPEPDPAARVATHFANDPTAQRLGIRLASVDAPDPSSIEVSAAMLVTDDHCNFMGGGHGGVTFAACDVVLSYLSNAFGPAVATHAAIDFVAPVAPGDELHVAGRLVERVGRSAIFDVEATVAGSTVALFRGTTREVRQRD